MKTDYIQTPLGSLCLILPLQSRLVVHELSANKSISRKMANIFRGNIILL